MKLSECEIGKVVILNGETITFEQRIGHIVGFTINCMKEVVPKVLFANCSYGENPRGVHPANLKIYKEPNNIKHTDLNSQYNCDLNLCVEDILNLIDCRKAIKDNMIIDRGIDLFPYTLESIISKWEEKIGRSAVDINENG